MNAATSPAVTTPSRAPELPYHSIRAMVIEVSPSTMAYSSASHTLVPMVAVAVPLEVVVELGEDPRLVAVQLDHLDAGDPLSGVRVEGGEVGAHRLEQPPQPAADQLHGQGQGRRHQNQGGGEPKDPARIIAARIPSTSSTSRTMVKAPADRVSPRASTSDVARGQQPPGGLPIEEALGQRQGVAEHLVPQPGDRLGGGVRDRQGVAALGDERDQHGPEVGQGDRGQGGLVPGQDGVVDRSLEKPGLHHGQQGGHRGQTDGDGVQGRVPPEEGDHLGHQAQVAGGRRSGPLAHSTPGSSRGSASDWRS